MAVKHKCHFASSKVALLVPSTANVQPCIEQYNDQVSSLATKLIVTCMTTNMAVRYHLLLIVIVSPWHIPTQSETLQDPTSLCH